MTSDIEMSVLKVPKSVTLQGNLHLAAMPEKWDRLFESIWPPRRVWERTVPYGSLGDVLRLFFPEIAFIERMNSRRIVEEWLAVWEIPAREPFTSAVRAWTRSEAGDRVSEEAIEQIQWEDIEWTEQELTFDYDSYENGTPALDPALYDALPALLCAELSSKSIEVSGRPLHFRRAYSGRSPTLVSWPPEDDGWSYVVTPRLLTLAGCQDLFLSLRSSIRRWENTPLESKGGYNRLSAKNDTSVCIEMPDNWFAGSRHSHKHSLVTIPIRLRGVESDGELNWQPVWSNKVEQVIAGLAVDPGLPTAAELASVPERFLNREFGKIGITVPSGSTNHRATTGVPLPDRKDIFEGLAGHLELWGLQRSGTPATCDFIRVKKKPSEVTEVL